MATVFNCENVDSSRLRDVLRREARGGAGRVGAEASYMGGSLLGARSAIFCQGNYNMSSIEIDHVDYLCCLHSEKSTMLIDSMECQQ